MDMNNVKEKTFLPTHLLCGILGLLLIGIGMVSLFMPVLAQPQDVMETNIAQQTQGAALLGLTPGAAASETVFMATRNADFENAVATSRAKPTTEAYGRHYEQWALTATAWAPFGQATSAAYALTVAVTHQAQTATWQARGPMWQMENDPLVKIADILQQDMVEQSSPIVTDTPTAEPIDWDVATAVWINDDGFGKVLEEVAEELAKDLPALISWWNMNYVEKRCYTIRGCNVHPESAQCHGGNPAWNGCLTQEVGLLRTNGAGLEAELSDG